MSDTETPDGHDHGEEEAAYREQAPARQRGGEPGADQEGDFPAGAEVDDNLGTPEPGQSG